MLRRATLPTTFSRLSSALCYHKIDGFPPGEKVRVFLCIVRTVGDTPGLVARRNPFAGMARRGTATPGGFLNHQIRSAGRA
jgi:hypothetical protein